MALGAAHYLRGPDLASAPEIPATRVMLNDGRGLHVQTREVTVSQWQACHLAGHCMLDIASVDTETDYPATGLNYPDAMEYISWVNSFAGPTWRLPTASVWQELAAEVMPDKAAPLFADPSLTWASAYLIEANTTGRALRPSGTFSTTSAGVENLDGKAFAPSSEPIFPPQKHGVFQQNWRKPDLRCGLYRWRQCGLSDVKLYS